MPMTTNAEKHSPVNQDIEFLRAVAIIFTLFQHLEYLLFWGQPTYKSVFLLFGFWSGVDLFFCISGFVIMRSMREQWLALETKPKKILQFALPFWIRRIWRLWPSACLWALLPVTGAAWLNQSGAFGAVKPMSFDAMAGILQFANFHWVGCYHFNTSNCNMDAWILVNYWSLSLEEQFYVLFPILIFLLKPRFLPVLLVVGILIQLPWLRAPLNAIWFFRTDALLIGILLALWSESPSHKKFSPVFMRHKWYAMPVILALIVCIAALSVPSNAKQLTTGAIALLCGLLVWLASYDQHYVWPKNGAQLFWGWIGSRSYSLYLIHMPVYALTRELLSRTSTAIPNTLGYVVVAIFLMVLFAEINYRTIEQPLRTYGRRIAGNLADMPAGAITR